MANQRLTITPCGKLPQPTFGLRICECDGLQFLLRAETQTQIPLKLKAQGPTQTEAEYWVCGNRVFRVLGADLVPEEELLLRIEHAIVNEQKKLQRIRRDVQAHQNSKTRSNSREHIPHDVRIYVWRRDEGKCVQCNSREKLEYDHIIPVSKGGSNTARNIRLLCETCNRRKGQMI
jgi:5-methylcytosine-specific restriction endonuclease McrA